MEAAQEVAQKELIERWGEMAAGWNVSRTMAQIYALLYAHSEPLDTDTIMRELGVSRGNANINLRKLQSWGLVVKTEKHETRRDFFAAEKDAWRLALNVFAQRRLREIKPVTDALRDIAEKLSASQDPNALALKKHIEELSDFVRLFDEFTFALLPLVVTKDSARLRLIIDFIKKTAQTA